MPVRKYSRAKKKKENKEPNGTKVDKNEEHRNGAKSSSSSLSSSSVNGGPSALSRMPRIHLQQQTKKSQKSSTTSSSSSTTTVMTLVASSSSNHHNTPRSIKELSSALNLSASLSSSFVATSASTSSAPKCYSNRKITDYFQIRKSSRKCKSDLDKEKHDSIEQAIKSGRDQDGLEVRVLPDKGRAVFAVRAFRRGDFICEYAGEMIPYTVAKKREEAYAQDQSIGCYMYFFEYKSKQLCIDATSESDRLGRLLNHSKLDGNCQAKLFETVARPYIILVAARDIQAGEELTYDYGERDKSAIEAHPWLAS